MIDWLNLAANSLWILGCSVGLATLSYAYWQAPARGQKLGALLKLPIYQLWINLAGLLFCLGLAATSAAIWEILLWLVLAGAFLFQTGLAIRQTRQA